MLANSQSIIRKANIRCHFSCSHRTIYRISTTTSPQGETPTRPIGTEPSAPPSIHHKLPSQIPLDIRLPSYWEKKGKTYSGTSCLGPIARLQLGTCISHSKTTACLHSSLITACILYPTSLDHLTCRTAQQ